MLGLFVDTVSAENMILLLNEENILERRSWIPHSNEAEKVLPAIKEMFETQQLSFTDLDAVGCVVGPGRFTSTRIGIMVANSFSSLLDIPVFGIDRLDLFFQRLKEKNDFPIHIGLETPRKDFFVRIYLSESQQTDVTLAPSFAQSNGKSLIIRSNGMIEGDFREDAFFPLEETVLKLFQEKERFAKKLLDPLYVREANITKRKKL